jgi:hypothetical protein
MLNSLVRSSKKHHAQQVTGLLDELVDALVEVHVNDARVRGVIYQNLGRLKTRHRSSGHQKTD